MHTCNMTCLTFRGIKCKYVQHATERCTYITEDIRGFVEVNEGKIHLKINKCCSVAPRVRHYVVLIFRLATTNK